MALAVRFGYCCLFVISLWIFWVAEQEWMNWAAITARICHGTWLPVTFKSMGPSLCFVLWCGSKNPLKHLLVHQKLDICGRKPTNQSDRHFLNNAGPSSLCASDELLSISILQISLPFIFSEVWKVVAFSAACPFFKRYLCIWRGVFAPPFGQFYFGCGW